MSDDIALALTITTLLAAGSLLAYCAGMAIGA